MPDAPPPAAVVLLDIEGTIAPISFVHQVLFPYARARLAGFLAAHAADPEIAGALAALDQITPGAPPLETLLALMDSDAKLAPLKLIQGQIWAQGFAAGVLTSQFYPDVVPALRAWRAAGARLAIYSSGSVQAQRLLFRHAPQGDLSDLITAHFDTTTGGKREPASYAAIARSLAASPATILFLSDVEAELAAATTAGMAACQIVRHQDGTIATPSYPHAADLADIEHALSRHRPPAPP